MVLNNIPAVLLGAPAWARVVTALNQFLSPLHVASSKLGVFLYPRNLVVYHGLSSISQECFFCGVNPEVHPFSPATLPDFSHVFSYF
jgi:hypothetical protein